MRIFAVSDLHADHPQNAAWIDALSATDYRADTLIVAGDVSDDLAILTRVLETLRAKFARVAFVPGNHELWVRRGEAPDSIAKFYTVLDAARTLGVDVEPVRHGAPEAGVWIVPLFGWYTTPEEGPDTLYLPAPGPDGGLRGWRDTRFTRWTALDGRTPAEYFLALNEERLARRYDAPVVSFSHFLPRREVMFRDRHSRPSRGPLRSRRFNFSRVAGTAGLERQLRRLDAFAHVYGHQHRNRRRSLEGVLYVSHCLGYARERREGRVGEVGTGPTVLWPLPGPSAEGGA